VVFHWSGGARDKVRARVLDTAPCVLTCERSFLPLQVESLEASEIRAVSWSDFSAGAENEHARGAIEAVAYDDDVRARNPPVVCLARARAMLGHRGLGAGVDTQGRAVDGYCPLTNNCEHLAVYVMTGSFRSLQVERAAAVAGLLLGDSGSGGSGGVDLPQLALVAGLGLGAVLVLSGSGAAPSDAEAPADQPQPSKREEAVPPLPAPHAAVLAPPPADAWRTALLRGTSSLPLDALACSGALNVELLTGEGAPFAPRRWLCAAERHDALPFSLCYGHRLHAEALSDATAAPFLALPSFQWAFQRRRGGCPPRGLRGALCSLAGPGHALFGLDHVRTRKFIAAGVCASFPGTDSDGIFHLGVRPTRDDAAVTLTLADYTDSADDAPVHPGFALRWAEPGGAAHAGRDWPYFACTPEGVRRAAPGEPPLGASRFRFWWREDDGSRGRVMQDDG
jgi:hypothetical protein